MTDDTSLFMLQIACIVNMVSLTIKKGWQHPQLEKYILQIENEQIDKLSDRVDAKDFIFKKHNSIFHDFSKC